MMSSARASALATLRGRIERIDANGGAQAPRRVALGHAEADAVLQGGLALGAVHEVFCESGRQSAAATGFIAGLTAREKEIKDLIAARGAGAYDGDTFRATVSIGERSTLDMDAVRAKLTPQFVAAHTRTADVITVRVVARVRDAA